MANIIDDILKRRQTNATQSFYPMGEGVDEQFDTTAPSPLIPEVKKTESAQDNIKSMQSDAQPTVKYPDKPQGQSDEVYEHLLKFYSPESISKGFAPYEADKDGGYLTRIYEMSKKMPTAPDQGQKNISTAAGALGDSLVLLGEIWAADQGALIDKRDPKDSAMRKVMDKQNEDENKYLKQLEQYEDGLQNSRIKDFVQGLEEYKANRKGMQGVLSQKEKQDQADKLAEQKQKNWESQFAFNQEKDKQARAQKDREYDMRVRNNESLSQYRNRMASSSEVRAKSSAEKDKAYIKRYGNGGAASKTVPLYFKDGVEINVPENVWKANYPVLVDILSEQGVATPREWRHKSPSSAQVEYFIKQNKDKLPNEAKTWLQEVSKLKGTEYAPVDESNGGEVDEWGEFEMSNF